MKKEQNKLSFENAMRRLEEIVRQMESDETPLEKLVSLYEEGVQLSRFCQDLLAKTEEKIETLTQSLNQSGEDEK